MGRISRLANPEFAQAVGELYAKGGSREEMAETFGAHKDTITDWCQDPRVQKYAAKYAQERVNRITRKLDSELENRINDIDDEERYPMELLLKMRKELLERAMKIDLTKASDQPETINEMVQNLEEDPELARQLVEWAKGTEKR